MDVSPGIVKRTWRKPHRPGSQRHDFVVGVGACGTRLFDSFKQKGGGRVGHPPLCRGDR